MLNKITLVKVSLSIPTGPVLHKFTGLQHCPLPYGYNTREFLFIRKYFFKVWKIRWSAGTSKNSQTVLMDRSRIKFFKIIPGLPGSLLIFLTIILLKT